jgi:hypothetical protein
MAAGSHILTKPEVNTLLAKTVSNLTVEEAQDLLDTVSRQYHAPAATFGSLLTNYAQYAEDAALR